MSNCSPGSAAGIISYSIYFQQTSDLWATKAIVVRTSIALSYLRRIVGGEDILCGQGTINTIDDIIITIFILLSLHTNNHDSR